MRKSLIVLTLPFLLSACASTPDPAKVCTAEWIKPRSEKAVAELVDETSSAMKSIRKVAESYMKGKTPGPVKMFTLQRSLKSVEKELTRGRGVKDLKTLAKTCDDPKILTQGLTTFVQGLGLPPQITGFIQNLPKYQELVAEHLNDIDKS